MKSRELTMNSHYIAYAGFLLKFILFPFTLKDK